MVTKTQTILTRTSLLAKPGEWFRALERGMDYEPIVDLHHRISVLEARLNAPNSNALAQEEANLTKSGRQSVLVLPPSRPSRGSRCGPSRP